MEVSPLLEPLADGQRKIHMISQFYETAKQIMDMAGAMLFILLSSPIWALTALAIKLEDGGPVLHRRRVVGKGGIVFDAFKFRSMCVNAHEVLASSPELKEKFERNFKLHSDPRITQVGKFIRRLSIDEFPQMINVLQGHMSLVGPRMIAPEELYKYGKYQERRLQVKPGISGYWQVNGRQNTPYEERIQMDMYYIAHRSLWLDMKILLKTVVVVLKGDGAV